MADVGHEQFVAGTVSRGQTGRHAGELRSAGAAFPDHFMDTAIKPLCALHHLGRRAGVNAHVPASKVQRQMRERAEREPTRDTARALAAKAVRHDHGVGELLELCG